MQFNPQLRVGGPPPIITDAPPKAIPLMMPPPVAGASSHSNLSSSSNSNMANSARTSQLTNVSVPKSPISYESSFTSPAMSPSFTPSLSPLATRSPSISPLVTPGTKSVSTSGNNTPSRGQHRAMNGHIVFGVSGSSGPSKSSIYETWLPWLLVRTVHL